MDNDVRKGLIEADPRLTTQELAIKMECSYEAIRVHLHQIGKVWKLGVWVPHVLSVQTIMQRVSIASTLLTRHKRELFLNRIVTGDEKWVLYVNVRRGGQWLGSGQQAIPTPKPNIHQKKIMLSIWWDMNGVVHWELLEPNLTITSDLYCAQMNRLSEALKKSRPSLVNRKGVILHHDNARPHVAKNTMQKLNELGWEILPHPPYSPDMAPTDYHLFRSLTNHLSNKEFKNQDEVKSSIAGFISGKTRDFFDSGIKKLVNRWQIIIETEGQYIID